MTKLLLYPLLALLILCGAVVGTVLFNRAPLFSPPGPLARLSVYLTSNVAETTDGTVFPELRTPVFDTDAKDLYGTLLGVVEGLGWYIVDRQPKQMSVHAVVSTPLWHFKDDVQVRVLPRGPHRSALWIHSQSRVGKADFAANSRHILDLIDALRERLAHP